ncbi:MAG: bifunctional 4-hydroxy-2-oxoglutarate aldolase/2-dehydro-3-deoxy-phosphogluconate aldolase [Bacteroidales bacterium]|jgi:2-dehydro-3-deoxyphosphogluconate aldolase/(4S)-4-hydroxy-2-oxoglutarate aldolase|nr:bifunctional 4-hydroxy-2-oxoglutarate aldolase/2-dehydro-3-deoxy-phosphogluconate aldolase [Bacteroidales bacterium]NLH24481.1 bifunctional 4-hydroxy-2-oxoglutarate aldolase/2-dehydro-3-deoxy-phosphogluconate aldolase [Bacteroidales bacterium]
MARFGKWEVMEAIFGTGFIPVFYHPDTQTAEKAMYACYRAGVRLFEFTNRGDFAHDVFASLEIFAAKKCPGLILGAGTVTDQATAALFLQLGASFIVGPNFNPSIAALCNRRQIPYIPGCATATEVGNAQEAGCDICKIFPADQIGGPSFVKSLKAPMPRSLFLISGGVKPEEANLQEWFRAGATCVGMGSALFTNELINAENWDSISGLCKRSLEAIARVRTKQ